MSPKRERKQKQSRPKRGSARSQSSAGVAKAERPEESDTSVGLLQRLRTSRERHEAALADLRAQVTEAITEMLQEEAEIQSEAAQAEEAPLPAEFVSNNYSHIYLLATHSQDGDDRPITNLEHLLRDAHTLCASPDELSVAIARWGLPGKVDRSRDPEMPIDLYQAFQEQTPDERTIRELNKLCPGIIYGHPGILKLIIQQTVTAACGLDTREVQDAKDWLRRVCIPKAPQTGRFVLSGRHLCHFERLYAEVLLIKFTTALLRRKKVDQSTVRTLLSQYVAGAENMDKALLDLVGGFVADKQVFATEDEGQGFTNPLNLAMQILSRMTGYDPSVRGTDRRGFSERTIRTALDQWHPEWRRRCSLVRKAMRSVADDVMKRAAPSLPPARSRSKTGY